MVAGFCCNTAVCGDGVLNLLSEGHWRGSRKRFNQSINQHLWSSSLSSSSSSSSSSASSSVVSWAQVNLLLFQQTRRWGWPTMEKNQLARPTGVVVRGVAIARETRTALTVNAATGHGATAIAKDAGLMIWRGRLKRRNQSSPEPRAIRTGRHQLWMRLPEATLARVLAGAMIEPQ